MLLSLAQGSRGARKKLSDLEFVSSQSLLRRFKYPKLIKEFSQTSILGLSYLGLCCFLGVQHWESDNQLTPGSCLAHMMEDDTPGLSSIETWQLTDPSPQNGKEFLTGMRVVYIDIMIHCYCLDRCVTM